MLFACVYACYYNTVGSRADALANQIREATRFREMRRNHQAALHRAALQAQQRVASNAQRLANGIRF